MITRKKIPSIGESVRKIIRGTSLNKSYMCRKINFMFIPSIIVQNCEGRAARPPSPDNVPPLPPPLP